MHSNIRKFFSTIYLENFSEDTEAKKELEKVHSEFKENKGSFFERKNIDKEVIVYGFISCIIMVSSFLGYWVLTLLLDSITFKFMDGVYVSLFILPSIFAGIMILKEIRKRRGAEK